MSEHTKGPWKVATWHYPQASLEVDREKIIVQSDHDIIAQMLRLWHPDRREKEMEANARLIANAPALLEALKSTQQRIEALQSCIPGRESRSRE